MRDYKIKTIDALSRGLEVLHALEAMRAATLHDLHRATGLSKSTLTRIIYTLYKRGMVWQRIVDRAFLPSHSLQQRAQLDDADWLAEIASPVLQRLCDKVSWPSVLTMPRLDYMEVIETNRPLSYFNDFLIGPVGYRVNMHRSASGRAYLAFCPIREREAVLRRLRARNQAGNERVADIEKIRQILETTRRRGYSLRDPDFGGHYSKSRSEADDGLNSIAVPIRINYQVLGCVNVTWKMKVMTVATAVKRHLADLTDAVRTIERCASEKDGALLLRQRSQTRRG